jgi:hypothetical protein
MRKIRFWTVRIAAALVAMAGVAIGLGTADASTPHKPAWLHTGVVHSYRDCGPKGHRQGVIVWGGNGDTSALVCKSGRAFTS